jgi:hypothetical protein
MIHGGRRVSTCCRGDVWDRGCVGGEGYEVGGRTVS